MELKKRYWKRKLNASVYIYCMVTVPYISKQKQQTIPLDNLTSLKIKIRIYQYKAAFIYIFQTCKYNLSQNGCKPQEFIYPGLISVQVFHRPILLFLYKQNNFTN